MINTPTTMGAALASYFQEESNPTMRINYIGLGHEKRGFEIDFWSIVDEMKLAAPNLEITTIGITLDDIYNHRIDDFDEVLITDLSDNSPTINGICFIPRVSYWGFCREADPRTISDNLMSKIIPGNGGAVFYQLDQDQGFRIPVKDFEKHLFFNNGRESLLKIISSKYGTSMAIKKRQ